MVASTSIDATVRKMTPVIPAASYDWRANLPVCSPEQLTRSYENIRRMLQSTGSERTYYELLVHGPNELRRIEIPSFDEPAAAVDRMLFGSLEAAAIYRHCSQ